MIPLSAVIGTVLAGGMFEGIPGLTARWWKRIAE